MKVESIFICCMLIGAVLSKPAKDGVKKDRVVDRPLSDSNHFEEEDEEHHNPQYDHDAFLGKDESKRFDNMSPEESKKALSKLVTNRIDTDKDGFVSNAELKKWIEHISTKYLKEDAEKQWKDYETKDGKLTWEVYQKKTLADSDESEEEQKKKEARDRRRFTKADQNADGALSLQEFTDFLHPEEVSHMKDIVIEETMEDIDKNKDGFVDMNEYISDMWSPTEGEKEPEWLTTEREQFTSQRDKDKDGKLNRDEVKDWIMPEDFGHVESEANHLIQQADANKDGKLSVDEILEKYDVFVGSQATDFGDVLTKHEEL